MTPENFCYWLQGLLEVAQPETLNSQQVAVIREHLQLVFHKETKLDIKFNKKAQQLIDDLRLEELYQDIVCSTMNKEFEKREKQQLCKDLAHTGDDASEVTVNEIYLSRDYDSNPKTNNWGQPIKGLKHVNQNVPLGFCCDNGGGQHNVHNDILKFADGPPRSC